MLDSLNLFHECLKNEETRYDEYYWHDEMIITQNLESPKTHIMKVWKKVWERITAAKIALEDDNKDSYIGCLKTIDNLLKSDKNANQLEFCSFFPVMDYNYSIYSKLSKEMRIEFLNDAVKMFIDKRYDCYFSHGFTVSTIQSRKDFAAHKAKGNSAKIKISDILKKYNYKESNDLTKPFSFHFLDKKRNNDDCVNHIINNGASWYKKWSKEHRNKKVDVIFRSKKKFFICEAKHLKEGGGGQDKQILELITFIKNFDHNHESEDVFYLAFLDGVYFNQLNNDGEEMRKIKNDIEDCLHKGKFSYFINTFGLKDLLHDISINNM